MSGNSAVALLAAARRALDGDLALPPARRTRAAALFTRTALEGIVDDAIDRVSLGSREACMHTKIICLKVLRPQVGGIAAWAWHALSETCHQHAYELTPTPIEITHLIAQVEALSRLSARDCASGPRRQSAASTAS